MKRHIFVINGYPRSGKDTFIELCYPHIPKDFLKYNISSVDAVKKAAFTLGWRGVKDIKGRQFLSDLKDLSTAAYNGPMEYLKERIDSLSKVHDSIFFVHIREPEEIARFVDQYPETVTIYMIRDNAETNHTNTGDSKVEKYCYNWYIENNSSIHYLGKTAKEFIQGVIK